MGNMSSPQHRRRFLAALGTGAVAVTAGCAEQLPIAIDEDENEHEDPPADEEDLTPDEDEEPPDDEEEDDEEEPPGQPALEWALGSDWATAQERTNIVIRDADELILGYDPAGEPISEFDAFWPLDEDDSDADMFADVLGNAALSHDPERWGFTDDIDPAAPGLLGGTSVEFSGDDALIHEGAPIDPSEDWTMGLWVWLDDDPGDEGHGNAMMLESVAGDDPDEDDEALGLLPNYDPSAFKIGSVGNTPGYGSEIDRRRWHFHVIRYHAADNRVQGYLDGEFDYSIQPEEGADWIPDLHDITLGRRRVGEADYIFHGRLDSPWITQGAVSEEAIQRLYDLVNDATGRVVTAPKSTLQEAVAIEVAADVPTETAVSVTLHQDTTADGESNISHTVDVAGDGATEVTGFAAGGAYWLEIELETDDPEVTPRVESVRVDLAADGDQ
jgi:hypothetical protein